MAGEVCRAALAGPDLRAGEVDLEDHAHSGTRLGGAPASAFGRCR